MHTSEPHQPSRRRQPPGLAGGGTRNARPWQNFVLGLACAGAIVAAYELVGPPSSSTTTTENRLVTVARGVVQATESASGNLAPVSESDLNFKSSGILTGLYVQAGQHVQAGQLLAEIDPTTASVALQQAEANLQAAQAKLAATEANPSGSASVGSGSGSSGAGAAAASFSGPTGASGASGSSGASGPSGVTAATGATASTTPPGATKPAPKKKATTTSAPSAVTKATDAANIASAQASVSSAELTVQSDESALAGTKLYAPSAGTIASISGAVGDAVTAGAGSASANAGSGASSTSGSGAASAFGASSSSSNASNSSSSSSSSAFIVLANLSAMQLVVSVSETDIGQVKVGQPATISVAALPSEEFAAKVTAISLLSSSSSGVVSYSVTIKLTQNSRQLRPGMTATATIVTGQVSDAVNVASAALTGSTVTVDRNGTMTVTRVITGLVGSSTTQIVAGLTPGEQVAIPVSTSIATSTATTGSGTLGSGTLGSGSLGGGAFTGGGGFARFGRGG